jgi:hypothetical protein
MARLYTNNASTTLASNIASGATSLTVAAGEGALFPNPTGGDTFTMTIEQGATREIVSVTARSTDTFTITRAQEGTSASAFTAGATIELRFTAASATAWEAALGAGGNTFSTIAVSGQSNVVADSANDTLTLAAGTGITLTTDASTDTVTIAASGGGGDAFTTIAVSGQSNIVADSSTDTLTVAAGTGITLTTDASTDTLTIAASADLIDTVLWQGTHFVNPNATNGTAPWTVFSNGTGALLSTIAPQQTLGLAQFVTGTTTTGRNGVYAWDGSANASLYVIGGNVQWRIFASAYIPTLSTVTETFVVSIGMARQLEADGNQARIAFVHDIATNATNWVARVTDGTAVTNVNTGVAISTTTLQRLEVRIAANGNTVEYFIDGVLSATITTNLPNNTGTSGHRIAPQMVITKSAGTTSRSFVADYFFVRAEKV